DRLRGMMLVPWKYDRCIVCLRQAKLTKEHLIPESLGGRLVTKFLCQPCNSTFGSRADVIARSDPSIRLAIGNLAKRLPSLAQKLSENQSYVAKSAGGWVKGDVKKRRFQVRSTRLADGSFIQPTHVAHRTVENILRKSGHEEPFLLDALHLFENTPENERVEIAPGLEIVKSSVCAQTGLRLTPGELLGALGSGVPRTWAEGDKRLPDRSAAVSRGHSTGQLLAGKARTVAKEVSLVLLQDRCWGNVVFYFSCAIPQFLSGT